MQRRLPSGISIECAIPGSQYSPSPTLATVANVAIRTKAIGF